MKKFNLLVFASFFSVSLFAQPIFDDANIQAEQNKQIILDWYNEGWNNNKYEELIPQMFHEDWSDGNPIRADHFDGLEGMFYMVRSYYQVFPDIHFEVTHIVADANSVAVRFEASGTHQGEIFGVKPTFKKVHTSAMAFFEMEDGKVRKTWKEMDLSGLLNQLTDNFAAK